MMTAILEEKAFPPTQTIDCTGKLVLGDRTFNCHVKTGHGPLNLADALKESCDVYFWEVGGNYLGPKKIEQYARMMGLGEKTGVDLPGEVAGLVPNPDWKLSRLNEMWVGGDTYNMSIGQGYTPAVRCQGSRKILRPHEGQHLQKEQQEFFRRLMTPDVQRDIVPET